VGWLSWGVVPSVALVGRTLLRRGFEGDGSWGEELGRRVVCKVKALMSSESGGWSRSVCISRRAGRMLASFGSSVSDTGDAVGVGTVGTGAGIDTGRAESLWDRAGDVGRRGLDSDSGSVVGQVSVRTGEASVVECESADGESNDVVCVVSVRWVEVSTSGIRPVFSSCGPCAGGQRDTCTWTFLWYVCFCCCCCCCRARRISSSFCWALIVL
jgi:hypothetical protein